MSDKFRAASTVAAAAREVQSHHSWMDRVTGIPAMVRAVFTGQWKDGSRFGVGVALAGLLYVLSPLDFIPEGIFAIVGLGDDVLVLGASTVYLLKSTDRWLDSTTPTDSTVIQGTVLQSTVSEPTGDR